MLNKILQFFLPAQQAATDLPTPPVPKVLNKPQAYPGHVKNVKTGETKVQKADRRMATSDALTFRSSGGTQQFLRNMAQVNPDLSSSVDGYLRTAITPGFTAIARNPDGSANPDATRALEQVLARFNYMPDYSQGFSTVSSLRSCSEQLGKQLRLYGACALELVLDKTRLPQRLQPVDVPSLTFITEDRYVRPVQSVGGTEIDLDIPTFFYVSLDQSLDTPYAESPMEAAIQPVLFDTEFLNDLRKLVKSAIHPRLSVEISTEALLRLLPPTITSDDEKAAFINNYIAALSDSLADLSPEDALVYMDTMKAEYLTRGYSSLDAEYRVLQDLVNSKLATGSKTMPSILGHGSGSNNIASSESMLFVKSATGAVQAKLNEIYSQCFTLAVRLMGHDCYVEFAYDEIDLRPSSELEAFRAMKQSRVLELLSLGLLTDEEAAIQLTGHLPPKGFTPLSGTRFHGQSKISENPHSNTSQGQGGTLNQNLKPDTPTGEKSKKQEKSK